MFALVETSVGGGAGGAKPYRTLSSRQTLFFEGDARACLYFVESGCLKLYRTLIDGQRQVVGFAKAGDVLGGEPGEAHANTAEAVTRVNVRAIPMRQVATLCRTDPEFAERLITQLGRQLGAAQAQIATIGAQNADQRIAGFLVSLAAENDGAAFELPMRRGDIAEFLGLRLETVSRKFSEFQRRGWMRLRGLYNVTLLRPDILTQLAAGGEAPCARAA